MKELLNSKIFELGNYYLKLSEVLTLIAFTLFIILVLKLIKRIINKAKRIDYAKKYSIYSLIKYCILVMASLMGLQILGFNLSVLVAGSAALLVGIGLGLQNLFSDFVSGIVLLIDSTIKVDDVVEINGLVCKVQEINLRTTTVLTRDDKYIILPNTDLTRNQLINWTHSNITSRFEILIGVDYSSNVKLVMQILEEATAKENGVLSNPKPFVRFLDFGSSSLNFGIYFWSNEVFRVEQIKSNIRVRIMEKLSENKITIPFPQRVLHIKK
ncbi:MAG: mechanosensitive ion channel [Bacteroidales bacterium]|nr:mechanosensitive ion channel [Bacteroidales bacterium]